MFFKTEANGGQRGGTEGGGGKEKKRGEGQRGGGGTERDNGEARTKPQAGANTTIFNNIEYTKQQ